MNTFEIRETDGIMYDDTWTINTSYYIGTMKTRAKDEKRALTRYLANKHGITFYKNRTRIIDDMDTITIIDRKTGCPLFIAIPLYD